MLVSFAVENWKSYRDRTVFTMVSESIGQDPFADPLEGGQPVMVSASQADLGVAEAKIAPEASVPTHPDQELWHGHRIPSIKSLGVKILPIAAIFGANASGKSNLFKALSFVQRCVVGDPDGEGNLDEADPFRLDPCASERPIRFCVQLLSKEKLYEYGFAVLSGTVIEERLVRHTKARELVLYERKGDEFDFGKPQQNRERLAEAAKGTPPDRLFLSLSPSLDTDNYGDVHEWFSESLVLASPRRRLSAKLLFEDPAVYPSFERIMPWLDTGISRFEQRELPLSNLSLPPALRRDLEASVGEGAYRDLPAGYSVPGAEVVTRRNGELLLKKLVPYRSGNGHDDVEFDLAQESDGTLHMINLLPALILLAHGGGDRVLFIDEFEGDLHSNTTTELIDKYLQECTTRSRSQLVFTTHETRLIGHNELSREEMWFCDKGGEGESNVIPLSGYEGIPPDADLDKLYLSGHLRGVPDLLGLGLGIPEAD